jgi:hypothetical protein
MQREEPALEMGLHAMAIAMRKSLSTEIDFQTLDGALNPGASAVPGLMANGMLGIVPIDGRKELTVDANLPCYRAG